MLFSVFSRQKSRPVGYDHSSGKRPWSSNLHTSTWILWIATSYDICRAKQYSWYQNHWSVTRNIPGSFKNITLSGFLWYMTNLLFNNSNQNHSLFCILACRRYRLVHRRTRRTTPVWSSCWANIWMSSWTTVSNFKERR